MIDIICSVLKSIEFDGTQEDSTAVEAKPIETLLLEKNKHLQTENTTLKVANQKAEGKQCYQTENNLI